MEMIKNMNSFLKWIGGKKSLRENIISEFPEGAERYIEVFGGAGWVLFAREKHAKFEVFNDINSDLINLYRCMKYHRAALEDELKYILHSREIFFDFKNQINIAGLTDIQRAARYYVIVRSSFGADTKSFATGVMNISKPIERFQEIEKRLERVIIENRDFESLINTYDRENALFYLDPPYVKAEKYYNCDFDMEDHIRLAEILKKIKGKCIISYNDEDFIWKLYKDFNIKRISRQNNLSSKEKVYKEVIIKNF